MTPLNFVKVFDARKTGIIGMMKKLWRYVKPFSYNTSVSQTDGRPELLYQYRESAKRCRYSVSYSYVPWYLYSFIILILVLLFPVLQWSQISCTFSPWPKTPSLKIHIRFDAECGLHVLWLTMWLLSKKTRSSAVADRTRNAALKIALCTAPVADMLCSASRPARLSYLYFF